MLNIPESRPESFTKEFGRRFSETSLKYMDRRGSSFKKILDSYEFQEHYTEEMKPEFKSSNSEFWLILKNLNYNAKNIGNDLSAKNADKKCR